MISYPYSTIRVVCCVFALGPVCTVSSAVAATYRAVSYMTSQNSAPVGIVEGAPGVFFVQASSSVVFSTTSEGVTTVLASFPSKYIVESSPGATSPNGLFYSSIEQVGTGGGSGNLLSVSSSAGSEQTYPAHRLAMTPVAGNLPNGKLFGRVYNFSNATNYLGTGDLSGNVTTFYRFPATDSPGVPIYGADGNYYGVSQGDTTAYFYRVTPAGTFTKIATLPFVSTAFAGENLALQGSDGDFYGIQSTGLGCSGSNQHGAVYKLTPTGQYTILHDFGVCSNAVVNSLIEGSDGKLYGATQGNNVIFSLTKTGTYKVLFETTNGVTQGLCTCILTQGGDGVIYGTALGGGPGGFGVVFALDAGLPMPKPRSQNFEPSSGAVGTNVRIWGYNLFSASVQFNGIPATNVTNSGSNYVWATVPEGAGTGPITITTPGGTAVTRDSFTVQ